VARRQRRADFAAAMALRHSPDTNGAYARGRFVTFESVASRGGVTPREPGMVIGTSASCSPCSNGSCRRPHPLRARNLRPG
jgi:hypothetical protein